MIKTIKQKALFSYLNARAALYTLESLPLPHINKWVTGETYRQPTVDQQKEAIQLSQVLLNNDAKDWVDGIYPLSVMKPDKPEEHLLSLAKVLSDSFLSSYRRRQGKTKEFSKKADDLTEFPDYYTRNFHHQTDGYLSEYSASLYEHQVELLFRGLALPMRRRLLKPMVKKLGKNKPLHILEVGCGVGTFTGMLAETFPNAQITAVDLSPSYIKVAKKRFINHKNIHFMQANAESLPFKSKNFDATLSVYLHHELPEKVRNDVIKETMRVTKNKGFWGLLDSIQLNDNKNLNWALESFPQTFHEPFYKNYISKPLLKALGTINDKFEYKQEVHLLSKAVYRV